MNRWGLRSATACAAMAAAIACSSTPTLSPPLGDCVGTPDAACTVNVPTGGGAGVPDASGFDGSVDSGVVTLPDSGICGLDSILAASPMRDFPECNSCIFNSPCCLSEGACAADSVCTAVVICVNNAGCTEANCVNQCLIDWAPTGTNQAFTDFAQCATLNCPSPRCTFVSPIVGDL